MSEHPVLIAAITFSGDDCGKEAGLIQMLIMSPSVVIIIRPHRSTTYVDVASRYRLSSTVCQSHS